MVLKEEVSLPAQGVCIRCNFVSSQQVCKACVLLEGLNKGLPRLGIGKSSKAKKMLEEYNAKQAELVSKDELQKAVNELNDDLTGKENQDSCLSRKGRCVTGLCKNTGSSTDSHHSNQDKKINNDKSCSSSEEIANNGEVKSNSKINRLLEEYGINNTIKEDEHVDADTKQIDTISDEEEGCGDSCGRLGSLHIGF